MFMRINELASILVFSTKIQWGSGGLGRGGGHGHSLLVFFPVNKFSRIWVESLTCNGMSAAIIGSC